MNNGEKYSVTAWEWLVWGVGMLLKIAFVAGIVGFIIYRVWFAPLKVDSRTVVVGPIAEEVMGTGTLEPKVSAIIGPRISGMITKVLVDQGDRVNKGQLLVTLYDDDLRQQVEIARADLAAMKASIDRADADIAAADPVAVQARATFGRTSRLFSQKIVSPDDFDKATQVRDVAEAQLKRAKMAKIEIEKQARKAEESLRYYQERLVDTKISCPFNGLVTRRQREPGDVVVPGGEILQIIATDPLWVSAWVDETAIKSVSVDQPVRVIFRATPDVSFQGTVTRIAPSIDRETREFLVNVTVRELPSSWAVGQRAEVYIQTARHETALGIPQAAVTWRDGKSGAFVDVAGRAGWRNITLGLLGAGDVEIAEGLASGDVVLWLGDPKKGPLSDGQAIVREGSL